MNQTEEEAKLDSTVVEAVMAKDTRPLHRDVLDHRDRRDDGDRNGEHSAVITMREILSL